MGEGRNQMDPGKLIDACVLVRRGWPFSRMARDRSIEPSPVGKHRLPARKPIGGGGVKDQEVTRALEINVKAAISHFLD